MKPRLLFFAGKGGVGKTTCAAAVAVAHAAAGRRVLVVSTDPAHSLGDVLAARLSSTPRGVASRLEAVELDAPRAFRRWLTEHRHALGNVLEQGTWLDRSDVDTLLDLTVPGIDELVGLLAIARLARRRANGSATCELVVVDMAPTGHALRLLAAPGTVAALANVLDELRADHRIIRERLGGSRRPEAADRLVDLLARQAADMSAVLRDPRRTTFEWVTLPETLAVAESEDGVAALTTSGMRVATVIVNRLLPAGDPCPLCDRRRASERQALAAIRRGIGRRRRVRRVAATLSEPRGIAALARIGSELIGRREPRPRDVFSRSTSSTAVAATFGGPQGPPYNPARLAAVETIPALRDARLLFVGGKGGVGKTTVAAALALRLARARPRESILLLSADPAHSLGDVFDCRIGDEARTVDGAPDNLVVREVSAAAVLEAKRAALVGALDEAASAFGAVDSSARDLVDLAPPGIDELFAMISVVEARARHRRIVVDTAPTGHALRLLKMPEVAREWIQALLRILLKYRSLARPGRFAAELVEASQSIRELQATLADDRITGFVLVSRASSVVRAETARLVRELRALGLSMPALVVNARTLTPGSCRRCRAVDGIERSEVEALRRLASRTGGRGPKRAADCAIIQTPLVAPPPRGPSALDAWAATWIA